MNAFLCTGGDLSSGGTAALGSCPRGLSGLEFGQEALHQIVVLLSDPVIVFFPRVSGVFVGDHLSKEIALGHAEL